ncbi:Secreted beta-glucosidase sun1 [Cytospora mali]|uniref:Secreted beta-glucosidase sun1 n=1 Tax=Cytospora mali TaxID=578113 RepID=A0A194V818_CYTMA|nr:Secreted beta-glucosidase sun1 [Valsa mali var. pyri (nom. inval.)]
MKAIINLAIAASLAAGATAQPHAHQHQHQHAKKHGSPVLNLERASPVLKGRDVVVWETPMVTTYVLAGESITKEEAENCLKDGSCEVVGETEPTFVAPTPSTTSTSSVPTTTSTSTSTTPSSSSSAVASSTKVAAAEFFEFGLGSSSSSSTVAATSAAASASATSSSSSSGATGIDADFPDGTLDCSAGVPTAYGAVEITHLGTDGWAGILDVGTTAFEIGSTKAIASFSVATSGGVSAGMFGLYACPEGYDGAQWPEEAQGATGQSIGGLWCGTDNKLYLTRADSTKKLCQAGAGGVKVINKLSDKVSFCKTLYPGTESMVIPTVVESGATAELYNPFQNLSYSWEGSSTSAQYYVNLKGLGEDIACVWDSPDPYSESAGNWAGVNLGTSVDDNGVTYLSIFHNTPTSDAALDFNIKLSGDISSDCTYDYSSNSFSPSNGNGCTVSTTGGTIYVTLSD